MTKNFKKYKINSGVTLIELMVVIFIFLIITSITIFNYGKFNSSVSIQNLADDVALSVRRAQSYAIGVRGSSGSFSDGYGIHFSVQEVPTDKEFYGSNKSFVLYSDTNSNKAYDHNNVNTCGVLSASNECMEVLSILSADKIKSITFITNGSPVSLTSDATMDIWFKRPNPEPNFCYRANGGTGDCDESTDISAVKITISNIPSPDVFKIITISNNGQISVSNNSHD